MAIKYGFFNSVSGDRKYNADDISNYFVKLISDGVFPTPATCLQVIESSGMNVNVSAGWGFVRCRWVHNTTYEALSIGASDLVLNRIDRVVIRLDPSARNITFVVKAGTPAATPEPPALTRVSDGVYELSLAQIAVNAGTSSITQADITDERPDADACGYVAGLIDQIDAANLFAQFSNAFYSWFNDVKSELVSATLIVPLRATYIVDDAETDEINISDLIPQYNYNLDILNVYVNGIKLVEGRDFNQTHDSQGNTSIVFPNFDLDVIGTPVEVEVLKGNDTTNAETIVSQVQSALTQLNGLSFRKLTQAQYDAMESHDANTLYIIKN